MYRAPLRSRRDDVDPQRAIDRAHSLGLCGFGGNDDPVRLAPRIERFAEMAGYPGRRIRAIPAAVVAAFGRGGRNFQQIHDAGVGDDSSRLWEPDARLRRASGVRIR